MNSRIPDSDAPQFRHMLFTTLQKSRVSKGAVSTSSGRSFLAPKFTYFDRLAREAQKRETGSIESGGDLRVWIPGFKN